MAYRRNPEEPRDEDGRGLVDGPFAGQNTEGRNRALSAPTEAAADASALGRLGAAELGCCGQEYEEDETRSAIGSPSYQQRVQAQAGKKGCEERNIKHQKEGKRKIHIMILRHRKLCIIHIHASSSEQL